MRVYSHQERVIIIIQVIDGVDCSLNICLGGHLVSNHLATLRGAMHVQVDRGSMG